MEDKHVNDIEMTEGDQKMVKPPQIETKKTVHKDIGGNNIYIEQFSPSKPSNGNDLSAMVKRTHSSNENSKMARTDVKNKTATNFLVGTNAEELGKMYLGPDSNNGAVSEINKDDN